MKLYYYFPEIVQYQYRYNIQPTLNMRCLDLELELVTDHGGAEGFL